MSTDLRVAALMQTDFVTLTPNMSMRTAVARLVEHQAPAAPVVDEAGGLIGILTQKDCFRAALHASYYQEWRGTVGEHMTPGAMTVAASDDVVRAAELFLDCPHRTFPVLEGGDLVGMLTRAQVLETLYRTG